MYFDSFFNRLKAKLISWHRKTKIAENSMLLQNKDTNQIFPKKTPHFPLFHSPTSGLPHQKRRIRTTIWEGEENNYITNQQNQG